MEKSLDYRDRIRSASAKVFSEDGFAKSRVSKICDLAGVAIGTFYHNFSDKDKVLSEIVEHMSEKICSGQHKKAQPADLEDLVKLTLKGFFEFVRENTAYYQALREAEFACPKVAVSFYEKYFEFLSKRFEIGDRELQEIFISCIVGAATFVATKAFIWEEEGRIGEDIVDKLAVMLVHGISRKNVSVAEAVRQIRPRKKLIKCGTKIRRRKQVVLQQAEKIFGTKGFRAASVADICLRSKVSIGMFYSFFDSKDDAFRQLVFMFKDGLVENAYRFSSRTMSRLQIEAASLKAFFHYISEHSFGYRILREAEFVDFESGRKYYLDLHREYAEMMEKYAKKDEFSIEDYNLLSLAMMGIGHFLGENYILWKKQKIDDRLFLKMVDTIFNGIRHAH